MKKLVILLLLAIGVVSCSDPHEGSNFRMEEIDPIARGLEAVPEYSMFVEMLNRANLYNALNLSGSYVFTVFVPSNTAVEKYLAYYTEYSSLDEMPDDEVEYLVKYHILSGLAIAEADLYLQLSIPTVTGKYLTADVNSETGDRYIDNGDDKNASTIIIGDMEYSNGYAHEVDNMLQPITVSIWDIVSANEEYTIFADLLEMCGLGGDSDYVGSDGTVLVSADTMLFNRYQTTINGVTIAEDKTLFVVPNDIFEANRINVAAGMVDKYPTGSDNLLDPAADLHQWVLYHAMYGAVGYSALTTFPSTISESNFPEQSHNLETMVTLSMLSVEDQSNVIYLNPHAGTTEGYIQFISWDTPAQNGYVHVVDKMMNIPSEVGPYTFVWDLLSKQEFQALTYYGYENRTDLPAKEEEIEEGQIPGLTWNSVPTSAAKIYYRNTGEESFTNGDALIVELGLTGYFDMVTPVLAATTYTPYTLTGTDTSISSLGYGKVSVDGSAIASSINFGSGVYTPVARTAVTFSEVATHILRIEPSGTSGAMGFDRIIFKPKK